MCVCECGQPAEPDWTLFGKDEITREVHRSRCNRRLNAKRQRDAARLAAAPSVLGEFGRSSDEVSSHFADELEQLADRITRLAILVGARFELSDDARRVEREAAEFRQLTSTLRVARDLFEEHQTARCQDDTPLSDVVNDFIDAQDEAQRLVARTEAFEKAANASLAKTTAVHQAQREAEARIGQAVRDRDEALTRALTAEAQSTQARAAVTAADQRLSAQQLAMAQTMAEREDRATAALLAAIEREQARAAAIEDRAYQQLNEPTNRWDPLDSLDVS